MVEVTRHVPLFKPIVTLASFEFRATERDLRRRTLLFGVYRISDQSGQHSRRGKVEPRADVLASRSRWLGHSPNRTLSRSNRHGT